ncbi:MAG TPA: hypothetical protein PK006_10055 [Saprospiraceae bacterium]|nr:hypothetical protein [Saprospiraceae bacterium]
MHKYELDSTERESFKQEAFHKYITFFESTLNIIDGRLDINDRYRSKCVMTNLFENSNTTVTDILKSKDPVIYKIHNYTNELFIESPKMPLLYKKFKYDTTFSFKEANYKGLNVDTDKKAYKIYFGEMFVLEKLINSVNIPGSLLNDPTFNAYEEGVLKEVKFRIGHDQNKNYDLKIEGIKIIPKENKAYNYQEIVDRIKKSPFPYSDKSEEMYIEALKDTIKQRDWEIDTSNFKGDSALLKKLETAEDKIELPKYQNPRAIDVLIPGYGHMRYGINKSYRIFKTATYSSLFIGSTAFAIYNKINANNVYKEHISAISFRESSKNYSKANQYHKKFIVSTGVAIGTFIANGVHIYFSHQKQQKRIQEAMKNRRNSLSILDKGRKYVPDIGFDGNLLFSWKF